MTIIFTLMVLVTTITNLYDLTIVINITQAIFIT